MPDPSGSPQMAWAATFLIEQPGLSIEEVMHRVKYPAKACQSRHKQKNISQMKRRIIRAAAAAGGRDSVGPSTILLQSSSNASSSIMAPQADSNATGNSTTSNKSKKSNVSLFF
jgi:hypothetical protein